MSREKNYQLEDGTMGSRSAFIRQEFAKNKSRKQIADELGVDNIRFEGENVHYEIDNN